MTKISSEAGGNVLSVGMPSGEAPAVDLNKDLLGIADKLDGDKGGMLPENKGEAEAKKAAIDAKKQALEQTAGMVMEGLAMAAGAACAKFPQLKPVWTEKVLNRIANAAAAVLLKYELDGTGFMSKYAEELELIMAAGEPLMASYFILKKANEEKAAKDQGASTAPGTELLPDSSNNNTVEPHGSGKPTSNTVATLG